MHLKTAVITFALLMCATQSLALEWQKPPLSPEVKKVLNESKKDHAFGLDLNNIEKFAISNKTLHIQTKNGDWFVIGIGTIAGPEKMAPIIAKKTKEFDLFSPYMAEANRLYTMGKNILDEFIDIWEKPADTLTATDLATADYLVDQYLAFIQRHHEQIPDNWIEIQGNTLGSHGIRYRAKLEENSLLPPSLMFGFYMRYVISQVPSENAKVLPEDRPGPSEVAHAITRYKELYPIVYPDAGAPGYNSVMNQWIEIIFGHNKSLADF